MTLKYSRAVQFRSRLSREGAVRPDSTEPFKIETAARSLRAPFTTLYFNVCSAGRLQQRAE